jgi:hypothetical protein
MKANAQVISERVDAFTGKRGKVEQTVLSCLDLDPAHPFLNTFDVVLDEDGKAKYSGKIVGKKIELGVRNFEPAFGGRLRARAEILSVA